MGAWRRVNKGNPCQVCGSEKYCGIHAEELNERTGEIDPEWVCCMKFGPGEVPLSPAWKFHLQVKHKLGQGGVAYKWVPADWHPGHAASPEQRAQWIEESKKRREEEARRKERKAQRARAMAGMCWERALATTRTPVDATLRTQARKEGRRDPQWDSPMCEGAERVAAYLASRKIFLNDHEMTIIGHVLRFCPDAPDYWRDGRWWGAPAMVAKVVGPASKFREGEKAAHELTQFGIHCTYLAPAGMPAKRPEDLGDARKMHGPVDGGWIPLWNTGASTIVVGEGIETVLSAWLGLRAVGVQADAWAAMDIAHLCNLRWPADRVGPAWNGEGNPPSERGNVSCVIFAGDTDASGDGQKGAHRAAAALVDRHPWLSAWVVLPQADKGVSVDWNDVMKRAGATAVGAHLADGCRTVDAHERWKTWRPGVEPIGVGAPRPPEEPQAERSPDKGAGSGKKPPKPPKVNYDALYEGGGGRGDRVALPDAALLRARTFLLTFFALQAPTVMVDAVDDRGNDYKRPTWPARSLSGFWLRRWNDGWWEYDGSRWHQLQDEHLAARIWHWLQSCWRTSADGWEGVEPSVNQVNEIVAALKTDTAVESESMPCWLPASFDQEGVPRWGTAAAGPRERRALPPSHNIVAFRNVLADTTAWADGELRLMHHHPCWLSSSVIPYDLPYELMAKVAAGELDEAGLYEQLCPTWRKFLAQVRENEDWEYGLQEFMGYTMVADNSLEMGAMIPGPSRAGKGVIETAHHAGIGTENITPTSFDDLTDKFSLLSFVGKLVAQMSDAHIGRFTDVTKATETFKVISGNGPIKLRMMYTQRMPSVHLKVRFIIYCNEVPSMHDSSTALAKRLLILPLTNTFAGREDPTLKDRVKLEAQGIGVWMLYGLQRLRRRMRDGLRFTTTEGGRQALAEFERQSSEAIAFIQDHLVLESGAMTPVDYVYAAWKAAAEQHGFKPGKVQTMGKALKAIIPQLDVKQLDWEETIDGIKHKPRVRVYVNLKLGSLPPAYKQPRLSAPDDTGRSPNEIPY